MNSFSTKNLLFLLGALLLGGSCSKDSNLDGTNTNLGMESESVDEGLLVEQNKLTGLNCGTVETEDFLSKQMGITSYSTTNIGSRIIKAQFHVIRRSNGTGGLTTAQVNSVLDILRSGFSSASICIVEKGRSFIDNGTFFSGSPGSNFGNIVNTNRHHDAINVYLLPTTNIEFGRADGITTNAYVISGSYILTNVQVHEFGHCLGLFHTHRGTSYEGGGTQCSELVNGSNSSVCGDLVTDTPADPRIWFGCTYVGNVTDANGDPYNPLTDNFMSYVSPPCLTAYTDQQTARMHTMIANNSTLKAASVRLLGPSGRICPSGVFTILNPLSTTATWSASPSHAVSLSGTGNSRTVTRIGNFIGTVTITVSYNTSCGSSSVSRSVYIGVPDQAALSIYSAANSVSQGLAMPFVALYPQRCTAVTDADWEALPDRTIYYNHGFPCMNENNTAAGISFSSSGTKQVRVKVRNSCGWSGWSQPKMITVN